VSEQDGSSQHVIQIRAVHLLTGAFDATCLREGGGLIDGAKNLEHADEESLSLECTCGERFLKWDTAEEHLREVVDGAE
jgi:hypothetical protein